jgi:hypothetical protein
MLRPRLESRGAEQAKTMGLADLDYCALKHDRNVVARLEISCNMRVTICLPNKYDVCNSDKMEKYNASL